MNLPFTFKPYTGRTGTGSKQFGPGVSSLCYATGDVEVVKDSQGKEVVSTKQLYVDGAVAIKELDNVVFENSESDVKAIGYFYRNGAVDMKVVYL